MSEYISKNKILNIEQSTLNCERPIVIFHPYFRVRFQRWKKCQLGSTFIGLADKSASYISRNWSKLMKSVFIPARYSCDFNHLDDYYVIDDDGLMYPVFLAVPCGHCSLCAKTRQDEFVNRCLLETYSSKYKPLFITLTYDNEHLPEDGVSVRDCQLFLKRLRKNLCTFFKHKVSIRYTIVSEYGHNTHRPHYHMLLWNMPYFDLSNLPFRTLCSYPIPIHDVTAFHVMSNFIRNAWQNGFVSVQVQKDVTGRYLAKYIGKGSDVPFGKNRCFMLSSRKRGIGFAAFEEFKQFLLDNPTQTSISFLDPKVGKEVTIAIPRYYRRLLCPSPSSFIKDDFKQKYTLFVNKCYGILYFSDHSDYYKPVRHDVYHMLRGLLSLYEPIKSYLTPDFPTFSKALYPQFYSAVVETDFDFGQMYLDACFLYDELLSYIPEFDWYLDALNWKEQNTLAIMQDTSPKKSVPDKIFTFETNNNKLIQKSIL